jgi:toxin-antitoxin system PIN domain toxin
MAGVIDTNLLLYAVNKDADEHAAAARFLRQAVASREPWFVTEGIVYEFLRVATHYRVFPRPLDWKAAVGFISALLQAENVLVLTAGERHWLCLEEVLAGLAHAAGNLFFDIRTAALMREHGIREIYTTDTDFLQFGAIQSINPLRA